MHIYAIPAMITTPAMPAITPPTIAPVSDLDFAFGFGDGEGVGELLFAPNGCANIEVRAVKLNGVSGPRTFAPPVPLPPINAVTTSGTVYVRDSLKDVFQE